MRVASPRGVAIDVLDAIGRETGLKFEGALRGTAMSVASDLRSGRALLTPVMMDAPDFRQSLTTSVPYLSSLWVIVMRTASPPLRNVDALAGKHVKLIADSAICSSFAAPSLTSNSRERHRCSARSMPCATATPTRR